MDRYQLESIMWERERNEWIPCGYSYSDWMMDPQINRSQYNKNRRRSHPNQIIPSSIHATKQGRAGMSSPPPPPPPPALELLLDEYWFFSNTLAKSNKPPPPPREDKNKAAGPSSRLYASGARRLLRTPSLPSPSNMSKVAERRRQEEDDAAGSGNPRQQQQQEEQEEDDLNWSSIYEGVLRTRMAEAASSSRSAALRRAPSMPVPSPSATKPTPAPTTSARRRPSPRSMPRSKSGVFRAEDNKWRSSGDLQGFRRPPALVRVQSEARSAAEVKDQLRMWAQAVACNVRQEC